MRVRFEITGVTKTGKVTVKTFPKVTNLKLLQKLNNETVAFYIQPYDRDDYNSRPKF